VPSATARAGVDCIGDLDAIRADVERVLSRLAAYFKPHCSVTFVMRNPRFPDGHLIVTSDQDLRALAAVLELEAERQAADGNS